MSIQGVSATFPVEKFKYVSTKSLIGDKGHYRILPEDTLYFKTKDILGRIEETEGFIEDNKLFIYDNDTFEEIECGFIPSSKMKEYSKGTCLQ